MLGSMVLVALACHDDPAGPSGRPPPKRQIAFSAEATPGNREIFVVDADGPGPIRLTDRPGADYAPRWTADGRRIRFRSLVGDGEAAVAGVYEMNVDGSGVHQVFDSLFEASLSPDGRKIAFVGEIIDDDHRQNHPDALFVRDANGGDATLVAYFGRAWCEPKPLTLPLDWDAACQNVVDPAWSPDGAWLSFVVRTYGLQSVSGWRLSQVYVVRPDGTDLRRLTTDAALDQDPTWSPDGQRLAVGSALPRTAAPCPLAFPQCFWPHVVRADGSERTLLTAAATAEFGLSWAPDGRRLAFAGRAAGSNPSDQGVYVVNADGTGLRHFPMPAAWPREPAWNPTMP